MLTLMNNLYKNKCIYIYIYIYIYISVQLWECPMSDHALGYLFRLTGLISAHHCLLRPISDPLVAN